uniref:Protein kinase domain-containing protein n=1 Tax=Panagrolaimus sp. ES5 TaxID=591445 RepID=A0AC34FJ79_9BILA
MVFRFLLSSSKDHFVVRWDYRAREKSNDSSKKFLSLKAGTIVRLIKFHRRLNEDGCEKKKIQNIAEIAVVTKSFQKGFIHVAFLQPLFSFGFPVSSVGLEYQKYYGIDDRLWDCRRLPLKTGPPLTLTQPFQILDKPVRGLPPHCHKKPGKEYKMPSNCSGLFVQNVINKQRFLTSFEIDIESSSLLGKTFYGIVRDGNEAAEIAAVKLLNKYWFDQGSFTADLALLKLSERKNNKALKSYNRNTYYIHGMEYLAKIVAHSNPQKIASPFVAYEFFPNLSIYDSLYYGRKFSSRTILEIIYQVAAAMFHLEINGLCHRSLCANNVIIHWDDEVSVSIKVTDYMLPSHHLVSKSDGEEGNEKGIKPIKWQWMSPESIFHGIFDIVSDSWSFGCFIFELLNDGAIPYSYESPAIKNIDLLKQFLLKNKRMKLRPNYDCPEEILVIFQNCFEQRPDRASFSQIVKLLNNILFDHLAKNLNKNRK